MSLASTSAASSVPPPNHPPPDASSSSPRPAPGFAACRTPPTATAATRTRPCSRVSSAHRTSRPPAARPARAHQHPMHELTCRAGECTIIRCPVPPPRFPMKPHFCAKAAATSSAASPPTAAAPSAPTHRRKLPKAPRPARMGTRRRHPPPPALLAHDPRRPPPPHPLLPQPRHPRVFLRLRPLCPHPLPHHLDPAGPDRLPPVPLDARRPRLPPLLASDPHPHRRARRRRAGHP